MTKKIQNIPDLLKDIGVEKDIQEEVKDKLQSRQISKKLLVLRNKVGLTQKELAVKSNCTQSKISKIESKKDTDLTLGEIEKYCTAFGVPLELTFMPKNIKIVNKVKYHFLSMRDNLQELKKMAKGDKKIEEGIQHFFNEVHVNLIDVLFDLAKHVDSKSMKRSPIEISEPIISGEKSSK